MNKDYIKNFLVMMCCLFFMFVLPIIMKNDIIRIVIDYNNQDKVKSTPEHITFWMLAMVLTAAWTWIWVKFKKAEKRCIQ